MRVPAAYWPDHWYHDEEHIHCIVPHCGFITPSPSLQPQWTQLHDHCATTLGGDHMILKEMLSQSMCAINGCNELAFRGQASTRVRELFDHEKSAHNSALMSSICSFVRLAREGRICSGGMRAPDPDCEKVAFSRMMEKIRALPNATIKTLYQKSGYHHPNDQTFVNMRKILTYDPFARPGEDPPYWWPIRAEHFLWQSRPHPFHPPDPEWENTWTHLRDEYANGRI